MLQLLLLGCLIGVCFFDLRYRQIPNWLCVIIAVLAFIYALINQQMMAGLMAASITFVIGLVLFAGNVMGAGDGKLASALALALLPSQLFDALMLTLFIGGILAILYLIKDRIIFIKEPKKTRGLPYGIAIALGFYLTIMANTIAL